MSGRSGTAISQLEKFTGHKFPKFLKDILLFCGFDNLHSLKGLNEGTIKLIEKELEENKHSLKKTIYEGKEPVVFQLVIKVCY